MHHLTRYLGLQQASPLIDEPAEANLALIAVIPCMHEPAMVELLDHLRSRDMPEACIEIIVVINHPCDAPDAVRQSNACALEQVAVWQRKYGAPAFNVYAIAAIDLAKKSSGVGVARKIGMDEAMRRLVSVGRANGIIASLDADCHVSANYFTGLLHAFSTRPDMHAATTAYAHRMTELDDVRHRQAIVCYELFLRYIELGWSFAGLPYAFTAIGSCFAVRANACARHHGMNKRQAGEDFYFLHKLARERPLGHIPDVSVYPSARMSSRTPFGTGQAVSDWYHSKQSTWQVCAPTAFAELKQMSGSLDQLFNIDTEIWLRSLPEPLQMYLQSCGIEQAVAGMRTNAASPASFRSRFFFWFDGLKAWRYVNQQAVIPVEQSLVGLMQMLGIAAVSDHSEALLQQLTRITPDWHRTCEKILP